MVKNLIITILIFIYELNMRRLSVTRTFENKYASFNYRKCSIGLIYLSVKRILSLLRIKIILDDFLLHRYSSESIFFYRLKYKMRGFEKVSSIR